MTDFAEEGLEWPSDFEITDPTEAYAAVNEGFPGTYEKPSDILKYSNLEIRNDRTLVLQIIQLDSRGLKFASDSIRDDENFLLSLLATSPACFEFASYRIRDDKTIISNACAINRDILGFISNRLKDDEEFIFQIAETYNTYSILKYVSNRLRNDLRVVAKAITKYPSDLKYANKSLLDNRYCVYFLLKTVMKTKNDNNNCFCYNYLSYRLRRDTELARRLAAFNGAFLKGFCEHLKQDATVVLEAVKSYPPAITYADVSLQKDKEIIYEALIFYVKNEQYDDLDLTEFWSKHICKEIQEEFLKGPHSFIEKRNQNKSMNLCDDNKKNNEDEDVLSKKKKMK